MDLWITYPKFQKAVGKTPKGEKQWFDLYQPMRL